MILLYACITPFSEEDIDIIKASVCFLSAISRSSKEHEADFFVDAIKLVLYALSRKQTPQEIKSKVIGELEEFLYHISHLLFKSKEFSVNKSLMQQEVQVNY